MQFVYTGSDILQGNAAYTADGSCKVFINDFLGDTNSFKNLGSLKDCMVEIPILEAIFTMPWITAQL